MRRSRIADLPRPPVARVVWGLQPFAELEHLQDFADMADLNDFAGTLWPMRKGRRPQTGEPHVRIPSWIHFKSPAPLREPGGRKRRSRSVRTSSTERYAVRLQ